MSKKKGDKKGNKIFYLFYFKIIRFEQYIIFQNI